MSAKTLKSALLRQGLALKTAESFTGGSIAAQIVKIAGASEFFLEGLVCYSPQSKISRLGVSKESMDSFGAVSLCVVRQMLLGLTSEGVLAIATTGNAGPTAQNGQNGTCFVGAAFQKNGQTKMLVYRLNLEGSRQSIIKAGAKKAIECACALLSK